MSEDRRDWLELYVRVNDTTGCWLWRLPDTDGYGSISGRPAHRVAYELFVGPIPAGSAVHRTCGQRSCVNPAHLQLHEHRTVPREIVLPADQALDRLHERFRAKTRSESATGCWLWVGTMGQGGYGRFRFNGQSWPAHRIAYELFVGPIPEGLVIDHLCCQKACVNPAHLEPVTLGENSRRANTWWGRYPSATGRKWRAEWRAAGGDEETLRALMDVASGLARRDWQLSIGRRHLDEALALLPAVSLAPQQ